MEITLEKIEIVKDRTGISYKEAKEVLEETEGDVVEAIIKVEERMNGSWMGGISDASEEVIEKLKDFIKKGNVSRVIVKKDEDIILNLPVTASAIGVVLAPIAAAVGVATAFVSKCKIEIVKNDGEVIDFTEFAEEKACDVKTKVQKVKSKVKKEKADQDESAENEETTEDAEIEIEIEEED